MAKDEEATATPEAPKGNNKTMLLIGGAVVLLLAVAIPLVLFLTKGEAKHTEELAADAADESDIMVPEGRDDEEELAEGEEPLGAIFPLEPFLVNVSNGGYIRCQIHVEFEERDIPKKFLARIPPVRDGIIKLLGSKSKDALLSEQGREALKGDIRDLTNLVLRKELVKRVYFTQYVVQR
jgi:flagellar protein FliL